MVIFATVENAARAATTAAGDPSFYPHAARAAWSGDLARKIRVEATTGLPEEFRFAKLSLAFGEERSGTSTVSDSHEL